MIVIGSMLSLVYYLRVIAAIWMDAGARARAGDGGRLAGGRRGLSHRGAPRPRWSPSRCLAGAATLFFGVIPGPLLDVAADAGRLLTG